MRLSALILVPLALTMIVARGLALSQNPKVFDLSTVRPRGAVFDINLGNGKVYAAQLSQNTVYVFDEDLNLLNTWNDIPTPHGVAIAQNGDVFVGAHRAGRVLKYDSQGKEIPDWDASLRKEGQIKAPVALTVGLDNNLYICDWIMDRVIETTIEGQFVRAFDDSALKKERSFKPHAVTVDRINKRVYVADTGTNNGHGVIHVFTLDGKYVSDWEKPSADFDPPSVKALAPGIYVVPNYTDGALYFFNPDGHLLERVDALGNTPGKFQRASGVVANKDGFLYVSELEGSRLQRVDFRELIKRHSK